MPKVKINEMYCKACGLCIEVCPKKSLKRAEKLNASGVAAPEWKETRKCTGCGMCYIMCPDAAIEIER